MGRESSNSAGPGAVVIDISRGIVLDWGRGVVICMGSSDTYGQWD